MDIVHGKQGQRKQKKTLGQINVVDRDTYDGMAIDARAVLIQELIPLGLMAISEELQREVQQLSGERYERKNDGGPRRYGSNPGTVRLMGQALPVRVPQSSLSVPSGQIDVPAPGPPSSQTPLSLY